jgi:hypothetical protein
LLQGVKIVRDGEFPAAPVVGGPICLWRSAAVIETTAMLSVPERSESEEAPSASGRGWLM